MNAVAQIVANDAAQYNEEDLRQTVIALKNETGMSWGALAKEAEMKAGTLSNWTGGTYQGDNQKVAGQVSQWLAARAERAEMKAQIPDAPTYVPTPTAKRINAILTFAQTAPDMVVIAAGPGGGKTTACDEYQRTHPNVYIITACPSVKNPTPILTELAIVMGIEEKLTSRLNRAIGSKLKNRTALLIVDEAQHVSLEGLEELRNLHDKQGVGLALVGAPDLLTKIEGRSREGKLSQLFSRVGMRMTQARPRAEDVTALVTAWGIVDPKLMNLCHKIAGRPGALRILTKTLKLASIVGAGEDEPALSEAGIKAAFQQLGDSLVS